MRFFWIFRSVRTNGGVRSPESRSFPGGNGLSDSRSFCRNSWERPFQRDFYFCRKFPGGRLQGYPERHLQALQALRSHLCRKNPDRPLQRLTRETSEGNFRETSSGDHQMFLPLQWFNWILYLRNPRNPNVFSNILNGKIQDRQQKGNLELKLLWEGFERCKTKRSPIKWK